LLSAGICGVWQPVSAQVTNPLSTNLQAGGNSFVGSSLTGNESANNLNVNGVQDVLQWGGSAVIGTPIPIGNNPLYGIAIRDLTIDGDRAGNSSVVGNYGI
jgi:hypothetical protein